MEEESILQQHYCLVKETEREGREKTKFFAFGLKRRRKFYLDLPLFAPMLQTSSFYSANKLTPLYTWVNSGLRLIL